MYTGVLLAGSGLALWGGTWVHVATLLGLVVVLAMKVRVEEAHLRHLYRDYPTYAQSVGCLVPRRQVLRRLWSGRASRAGR
jgi:protein-S-isoprenylcysteine O-methyltransferase Ste14